MRKINKLTTVDVMHSHHGNDMHTHFDHDNDMHTQSEHSNEMQPIVNICNYILSDENGSGSDIDSIYNVFDHNTLEQVFEPCPSDTLYTVDHMSPCSGLLYKHNKLFSEWMRKFTKGEAKIIISDSQTPGYEKSRSLSYAINEQVEDELSNIVRKTLCRLFHTVIGLRPLDPYRKLAVVFKFVEISKLLYTKYVNLTPTRLHG